MRIIALPARANRDKNSYNAQLYDHLGELGWTAEDASLRACLGQPYDVFHVHWPQEPASKPFPIAARRAILLLTFLVLTRLRGGQNVWTVHNVRSHEQKRPLFEKLLMNLVTRQLDGLIVLNGASLGDATSAWPRLRGKPVAAIPHGLYEDAFPVPPSTSDARERFGLGDARPIVGIIGELKPYKGLDRALASVLALPPGAVTLFVAGGFRNPEDRSFITDQVTAANRDGWDIALREGRLDDADLVAALTACDLVLFPYKTASNSGLTILAAELGVPMLLADTPAFRELAGELGSPSAVIAQADFSREELYAAALRARAAGHVQPNSQFTHYRSQANVAHLTAQFFQRLVGS